MTEKDAFENEREALRVALEPHIGTKVTVEFGVDDPYFLVPGDDGEMKPGGEGTEQGKLVQFPNGTMGLLPPRARKNAKYLNPKGSSNGAFGTAHVVYVREVRDSKSEQVLYSVA